VTTDQLAAVDEHRAHIDDERDIPRPKVAREEEEPDGRPDDV
jgi:hypothetical protein